jgi:hypothetical protein
MGIKLKETAMTTLLEEAFSKASKLSSKEQDSLAALVLEEIDSEGRWDELFAQSQDQLAELAEEALTEFRKGKTKSLEKESG